MNAYEKLSDLGSGTFGRVYQCRHKVSGRSVAVKELPRDKFREQVIVNEVDILRKLIRHGVEENHFIIQTLDIIEEPTRICLVFELMDKSLFHLLKERRFRPLPLTDIRAIAYQLFSALQRLSTLHLLHTDIKPENVMLVNHKIWPYRVKLIDFGSASRGSTARMYRSPYIQSRFYRSPEILVGSEFSEAIDMWSVGCVLSEICVGLPLYPGTTEYDQIRYMIDMQGQFPESMLRDGEKTEKYFTRVHLPQCPLQYILYPHGFSHSPKAKENCECPWRLKTNFEYASETGTQSVESRKLRFRNLAHLAQWRRYYLKEQRPGFEDAVETSDIVGFSDLLQMTLALDPKNRIKPEEAICHDFITGRYFIHCDGRHEYIKRTNDSFLGAFGLPLVGMHYIPTRNTEVGFWSHNSVQQRPDYTSTSTLVSTNTRYIAPYNVLGHSSAVDYGSSWTNESDASGCLQRKQPLPIHYAIFPWGDISHAPKRGSVPNLDKLEQMWERNIANDGKRNSSKNFVTRSGENAKTSASTSKVKIDAWSSGSQYQICNVENRTIKNEMRIFPKSLVDNTKQIGLEHNYYDVDANEVGKVTKRIASEKRALPAPKAPPEMYDSAVLYSSPVVAETAIVPINPSQYILLGNSDYRDCGIATQNSVMKAEWSNLMPSGTCHTISNPRTYFNPLPDHTATFFTPCSDDIKVYPTLTSRSQEVSRIGTVLQEANLPTTHFH